MSPEREGRGDGVAISVVVPARNEAEEIQATLSHVRAGEPHEILVVDGGSTDDTVARAGALADRVLVSKPGRARQMNRGAGEASGDVLLFLHADTWLPVGWPRAVEQAISSGAIGGRFDVVLRGSHPRLRTIAALMNRRSRLTGIFTGDQAIFVRRDVFERLGGFEALPLFEDIALARRLRRAGKVAALREKVSTSARRWDENGVWRTIFLMWCLRLGYFLGISPARLARLYGIDVARVMED